ncbi:MAG TPA: hypothetical protein PKV66_00735, partial [Candidatus Pelethenecus sp.]|nr:hypothetical protein [Candidatus Pelethenecus sp.]
MVYTTTKCSNCGYKTRNHESGVPRVQIGWPISVCPQCGHLILDSITTEYEFMTESEKAKFTSKSSAIKSSPGNIIFIIFGLFFFIGGIVGAEGIYIAVCIIIGLLCIGIGVGQIFHNQKMVKDEIIEQCVYESLKRTANPEYVKIIQRAYAANGIKRKYTPYARKEDFIEQYKKFELRESHKENMDAFTELFALLESNNTSVERAKNSTFTQ